MGDHVGYARVSSTEQSLDIQIARLEHAGCRKIFSEKVSGTTRERPALYACLSYIREGDTLVVTRIDRLARSTLHLCQIAEQLHQQAIHLHFLDQHIDTSSLEGRFYLHLLGAIAEFETGLRRERQREGIDYARQQGRLLGRQPVLTPEQCRLLRQQRQDGTRIKDLMRQYSLSKASVYRYLAETTSLRIDTTEKE